MVKQCSGIKTTSLLRKGERKGEEKEINRRINKCRDASGSQGRT
jgi:hypothetical protein